MNLITTLAMSLVAGAALTIGISVYEAGQPERLGTPRHFHDYDLDPPVGRLLPSVERLGLSGAPSLRHFVLFIGACGSCSIKHMVPERIPFNRYADVDIVAFGVEKDVPEVFKHLSKNVKIVCDPAGEIYQGWNATFQPRWYVVDSKGRLLEMQANINSDRFGLAK